ncbi:MAG: HDOD domain-containing protein [Planctomycetota bacterium]|nr:HDOD domain-containing protein [Planctomycetota bacterium]
MVDVLRSIMADMRSLAPFPHVATTVLDIATRPGVTPQHLIPVIQTDPGLTCKLLMLSNSAYYGYQREIASLEEAGDILGGRTITSLVLASCASSDFNKTNPSTTTDSTSSWRDAVTTAIAARLVAKRTGCTDPERAYTAGLLMNVGELMLERYYEEGQHQVEQEVPLGRPRITAEKVVLGISHAELGARLVARWMLPQVLIDTIRFHQAPEKAVLDPSLTATVHLAEALTTHSKTGDNSDDGLIHSTFPVSDLAWKRADMLPHDLLELRQQLSDELNKAEDLFAA